MNDKCPHDLFAHHADTTPDAIAVVQGDQSITYGELRARSRLLAAALRERHVGPDVVVGLHVPRSIDMLVGILGILQAGGVYLPLWVGHPADRLQFTLAHSAATVLVTSEASSGSLPEFGETRIGVDAGSTTTATDPGRRATPDNLGGDALARGHHNRPDLTATFVPDPSGSRPDARLHRSCDLARVLPGRNWRP